jgi:hypothetical protein
MVVLVVIRIKGGGSMCVVLYVELSWNQGLAWSLLLQSGVYKPSVKDQAFKRVLTVFFNTVKTKEILQTALDFDFFSISLVVYIIKHFSQTQYFLKPVSTIYSTGNGY